MRGSLLFTMQVHQLNNFQRKFYMRSGFMRVPIVFLLITLKNVEFLGLDSFLTYFWQLYLHMQSRGGSLVGHQYLLDVAKKEKK